jgi:hypothetical protein
MTDGFLNTLLVSDSSPSARDSSRRDPELIQGCEPFQRQATDHTVHTDHPGVRGAISGTASACTARLSPRQPLPEHATDDIFDGVPHCDHIRRIARLSGHEIAVGGVPVGMGKH